MKDPIAELSAEIAAEQAAEAAAETKGADTEVKASVEPPKKEAAPKPAPKEEKATPEVEAKADDEGDKPAKEKEVVSADRLNQAVAQRHRERQAREAAERERDELRARLAEAEKKPDDGTKPAKTEAEIRAEIRAELEREAYAKEFNAAANRVFAEGTKQYGEEAFAAARDALNEIGFGSDVGTVQTMLDTSAPEKVLYLLSQDLDEADRIFKLPPAKQAIAMERLANKRIQSAAPDKKRVSDAPDPIRPVNGDTGAAELDILDDSVPMNKDWVAKFDKMVARN